jgi:hypothetical protein
MEDLFQIFNTLKPLLLEYSPPLTPKNDAEGNYDLWSPQNVVIGGRKYKEVYFASLVIQKNYVGFYFMPVYMDSGIKNILGAELLNKLKGKSCFHIKKLDDTLLEQIRSALKIGFDYYQKNGWV